MIEFVEKVTQETEEIVEELAHTIGVVITKTTPLLAPVASGLTILFSVYDGLGKMFERAAMSHPYTVSLLAGLVIMGVVEGLNFAAIFNQDRLDDVRRSLPDAAPGTNAGVTVAMCLWLTVLSVAGLESIPGIVSYWMGDIQVGDMMFRVGLLVFPFFSRAGARIFSLSSILDSIQGVDKQRQDRRKQKRDDDLKARIAEKKAEQDLKIRMIEAEAKINAKYGKSVAGSVARNVATTDSDVVEDVPFTPATTPAQHNSATTVADADATRSDDSATARRNTLLDLLDQMGDVGDTKFGNLLGVERTTIYRDFKALEKAGEVHKNGNGWERNGR